MSHLLLNSFKIQIKNMEITSSERFTLKMKSKIFFIQEDDDGQKRGERPLFLSVIKAMMDKKEKTPLLSVRHEGDDGQKKRERPGFCPS